MRPSLLMEYVAGGNIELLVNKFGALSESIVRLYALQIMTALDTLHSRDEAHGAVRSSNVLLESEGIVKLAGYGLQVLSERGGEDGDANIVVRCKEDIWRAGCVILDMLTGTTKYSSPQELGDPPSIPESVSPEAQDFLLQCFNREPASRPTAAACQAHPFVGIRGRSRSRHDSRAAATGLRNAMRSLGHKNNFSEHKLY